MKVKLKEVFETQTFPSGFQKREFIGVDQSNPTYPQYLKFELLKDACTKIDGFTVGNIIDVEFNIRGNKHENPTKGTQYFVSLQAWRLSGAGEAPNQAGTPQAETPSSNEAEDLPF